MPQTNPSGFGSLYGIIEAAGLSDDVTQQLKSKIDEMTSRTNEIPNVQNVEMDLRARIAVEPDWRQRAAMAAKIISLNL